MAEEDDKVVKISPKSQFQDWFNPRGNNVFGTGLSMEEYMAWSLVNNTRNSMPLIRDRIETNRRRDLILQLSKAIYDLAPDRHFFSIRIAESAIDEIILGDWARVKDIETFLTFAMEDKALQEVYEPVYAPIREILHRAWSEAPPIQEPLTEMAVIPGGL
jgi:hypothetical protein